MLVGERKRLKKTEILGECRYTETSQKLPLYCLGFEKYLLEKLK